MPVVLRRAMVFAAGFGKRMLPLTLERPKPLLEVGGRSLLDRALDALETARFELAVVNSHHLAEQVHEAVQARARAGRGPRVVLSHEPTILETGGGLMQALGLLGREPFVSLNADVVWVDGEGPSALTRLAHAFEPDRMDALLLLADRAGAIGYGGPGDFSLQPTGQLVRHDAPPRPYAFTGLQVWNPQVFAGLAAEPFSLGDLYWARREQDDSLRRLHGLVHTGDFLHVGTPGELNEAERYFAKAAR